MLRDQLLSFWPLNVARIEYVPKCGRCQMSTRQKWFKLCDQTVWNVTFQSCQIEITCLFWLEGNWPTTFSCFEMGKPKPSWFGSGGCFNHPLTDTVCSACSSPTSFPWMEYYSFIVMLWIVCMKQKCSELSHTWLCVVLQLQNRFAQGGNRFLSACRLCVYLHKKVGWTTNTVTHGESHSTLNVTDAANSKLIVWWHWFPLPWMGDCIDRLCPATRITKSDLLERWPVPLSPCASV